VSELLTVLDMQVSGFYCNEAMQFGNASAAVYAWLQHHSVVVPELLNALDMQVGQLLFNLPGSEAPAAAAAAAGPALGLILIVVRSGRACVL
jgi:hypothetical protein